MLSISGKPLLRRLVDEFKKQAVNKINVVAGYKADTVDISGINVLINEEYESTGELYSLACAENNFHDNMMIMYGDVLFRSYVLDDLLDQQANIVIVVDSMLEGTHISGSPDFAYCTQADDRSLFRQEVLMEHISDQRDSERVEPSGRWIGMLKVNSEGRKDLEDALEQLKNEDNFRLLGMPDLLNHLVKTGKKVHVHYINGHWLDVNSLDDIDRASDFTHGQ